MRLSIIDRWPALFKLEAFRCSAIRYSYVLLTRKLPVRAVKSSSIHGHGNPAHWSQVRSQTSLYTTAMHRRHGHVRDVVSDSSPRGIEYQQARQYRPGSALGRTVPAAAQLRPNFPPTVAVDPPHPHTFCPLQPQVTSGSGTPVFGFSWPRSTEFLGTHAGSPTAYQPP